MCKSVKNTLPFFPEKVLDLMKSGTFVFFNTKVI